MPDPTPTPDAPPDRPAAPGAGCVLLVIDESPAMAARVAGGTKSRGETVATAVNSALRQLEAVPRIDVALVGCHAGADGRQEIGSRWGGPLTGRQFVPSDDLAASPAAIEQRVRKVPSSDASGVREESVPFPVWYVPSPGQAPAWPEVGRCVRQLLDDWLARAAADAKPPLVLTFLGDLGEAGPAAAGWEAVLGVHGPCAGPLLLCAHLATMPHAPPTLYPSTDAHLPTAPLRALFAAVSVLPQPLVLELRHAKLSVGEGARGLVYNARLSDLIHFVSLVRAYAAWRPPAAPVRPAVVAAPAIAPVPVAATPPAATPARSASEGESAPPPAIADPRLRVGLVFSAPEPALPPPAEGAPLPAPQTALVVFLLDRSVEDPAAAGQQSAWRRLEQHANELLGQIAQRGQGRIQVAAIAYGGTPDGESRLESAFAGPLAGRDIVAAADLAAGTLRVEEVTEQVSNGIGGLVSVARKRPIWIDLEPMSGDSPGAAFSAAARLLAEWRGAHPDRPLLPVVLHLTRGRFAPGEIESAAARLAADLPVPPALCHLVVTESPHRSLAYPDDPAAIEAPSLRALWEATSPLPGRERLASQRRTLSAQARGMVVNARFDLLVDGMLETVGNRP